MAKRRGRGEGSISLRPDGRWQARVDMGRGPDGRRRRKVVYGATRQAVASELNKLLGRAEAGELLATSTPTVASWLAEWQRTHADDWRPATRRLYRIAVDQWIVPALGTTRLEKLKPATIQRWVNAATAAGPSPRIAMAHLVLRSALKWAMQQRVLTYNPAALVKVPAVTPKTVAPLSVEDARRLLTAAADHRLGAMFVVSLTMGLRIGEASGLTWGDVDLAAKVLRVRQQAQALGQGGVALVDLKTASSRRTLAIPTLALAALKAHRRRQAEERLKSGERWHQGNDLVFTTPNGRPVNPSTTRDALAALLKAAGLPPTRYHALRHTAATLLLLDGTPLFDVSRVLGHAQISTTADTYGHLLPEMAAGAAARMDALLKRSN